MQFSDCVDAQAGLFLCCSPSIKKLGLPQHGPILDRNQESIFRLQFRGWLIRSLVQFAFGFVYLQMIQNYAVLMSKKDKKKIALQNWATIEYSVLKFCSHIVGPTSLEYITTIYDLKFIL